MTASAAEQDATGFEQSTDLDESVVAEKDLSLDDDGFKKKTINERIYRSVAMLVFVFVFPIVFLFLGLYRGISLLATGSDCSAVVKEDTDQSSKKGR